jgi:hypothetical protein
MKIDMAVDAVICEPVSAGKFPALCVKAAKIALDKGHLPKVVRKISRNFSCLNDLVKICRQGRVRCSRRELARIAQGSRRVRFLQLFWF